MDLEHFAIVDKLKSKMLKYIFYKKRTEKEIRDKFKDEDPDILEETIENLKELGYINDKDYVERFIHDAIILKNLSIFELKFKLYSKGANEDAIDSYMNENQDMLEEYELKSAQNIYNKKKSSMEDDEIDMYLKKKRYKSDTLKNISRE